MNDTPKDGGPAFPNPNGGDCRTYEDGTTNWQYPATAGMSLRDWFAGQYLNGIAAGSVIEDTAVRIGDLARKQNKSVANFIASMAYEAADAMIAFRDKK